MVIQENVMSEKIDQNMFLKYLEECGYDENILIKFFDCNNVTSEDKILFNQSLQKINKEHGIDFFDMLLCFEKYFTDSKKLIQFIDLKTFEKLKKELKKDFFITDNESDWGSL